MCDSVVKTDVPRAKDIFPGEAWEMISRKREDDDLIIIDVSTPGEYRKLHLEGAVNVNLFSRSFKTRLDAMNRNKAYVLYCKMGGRSKIAQKLMQQLGFQRVYNMVGGTILWEEEGLPFSSGTEGANGLSFCPVVLSVVTVRKLKKAFHNALPRMVQRRGKGVAASAGQES